MLAFSHFPQICDADNTMKCSCMYTIYILNEGVYVTTFSLSLQSDACMFLLSELGALLKWQHLLNLNSSTSKHNMCEYVGLSLHFYVLRRHISVNRRSSLYSENNKMVNWVHIIVVFGVLAAVVQNASVFIYFLDFILELMHVSSETCNYLRPYWIYQSFPVKHHNFQVTWKHHQHQHLHFHEPTVTHRLLLLLLRFLLVSHGPGWCVHGCFDAFWRLLNDSVAHSARMGTRLTQSALSSTAIYLITINAPQPL